MIDSASFRKRFPTLNRTAYLASCSLGAPSSDLDRALACMLEAMAGAESAWHAFEHQVHDARRRFARLIGARSDQVAIVPNASVGAYQVASTVDWNDRPRIVTTDVEFPSIAHVWLAQRARGAQVDYVPDEGRAIVASDYVHRLDARTGIVSVPLATYRNGARLPVPDIAHAAHELGARVFVDAYQAAGVMPVNVDVLQCDYLVAGSMKYLLGLPGVAFLYARSATETDLRPTLTGWFGRVDPMSFDPRRLDFPATARRFETGTPDVPALYAANAGLALLETVDPSAVHAHIGHLTHVAASRLSAQGERLRVPSEPDARGAIVAVVDDDPDALTTWLADRHVTVSPRRDVIRLSFHYYNNLDDVQAVCEALREYRRLR